LLPAVQAAREAARRTESRNHLKQVGIAIHNYHDQKSHFPPRAQFDPAGKPLLSWRVLLLPYLGEKALYREFKLDEPWDSPHNKKLIARMPDVYRDPNDPSAGHTHYLVPIGPGTIFEGSKPIRIRDITDGTAFTIYAVAADHGVVWTKPDDLAFDPAHPMQGLGNLRPEGFLALMADGSVRFIPNSVPRDGLKALFTYQGGELPGLENN
jgi:hypothetical protein